jgi:predicted DNA-binding transcriptional regulator AlpA
MSRVPVENGAADTAFAELRRCLDALSNEGLPAFMAGLAELDAAARLRLVMPKRAGPEIPADKLLNVEEAAKRMALSSSTLYKTAMEFPFTIRIGRALRFSSVGIDRWIAARAR